MTSALQLIRNVVDLTKPASDLAREKQIYQSIIFPTLYVYARPSLKMQEINDEPILDTKMRAVLSQSETKLTEWLFEKGLLRSEQTCVYHRVPLKLGMYFKSS